MKVFSCFHPKVITNSYSGQKLVAKCGKCPACLNARISDWITRLNMESDCHRYVFFFTLTYDEQSVPQIVRLRKEDYPRPAYLDNETGEIIDMSEVKATFTKHDKQFVWDNKVLNVLSKRDLQNFIKRLRYYFDQCEKGAKLRYYLCGEIGPTTYRPHGHCILFFDSEKCATNLPLLLSKSWKYGITYDPHSVTGSAASYCAAYVNGTSELPKCYLHESIKPFAIYSKSPAIGTLLPNLQDIKKLFEEKPITFRRFDPVSSSFKDEYIPRSLKNRLFPRCQRFSCLSHADRIILYRLLDQFPVTYSTRQIADYIRERYTSPRGRDLKECSFLTRYFYEISHKDVVGYVVKSDKFDTKQQFKDYPFLPSGPISTPFYLYKTIRKEYCHDSVIRFVRTIKRVAYQAAIFGISIDDYVKHIEDYETKVEKFRQRQDYKYQDEFFKSHPKSDFVFFDYDFYRRVRKCDPATLSDTDLYYLKNMGLSPSDVQNPLNSHEFHTEYQNMVLLHTKIQHDLVKQKKNNDYALAAKDKYGRLITIKNL